MSFNPLTVLETFHDAARRTLSVDAVIDAYIEGLVAALSPAFVDVALDDGRGGAWGAEPGRDELPAVTVPIASEAGDIGRVRFGPRESGEPYTNQDAQLMLDLTRRFEMWLGMLDRVARDREQQAHIAALSEAQVMQSQFLDMVSHELRRPLTSMLASLNVLGREGAHSEGAAKQLETHLPRIQKSARTLARLVNDLLDAGQLQAGQFAIHRSPLDTGKVLGEAIETSRPLAEAKGVKLVAEGESHPLEGDAQRLVQVLTNLIANAVRHTAAGGTISVSQAADAKTWRCAVRDSGEGMDETQLAGLFQRFGRVGRDTGEGLGLGLFISQAIAAAHGGAIAVESQPGKGSTFTLQIPTPQS